MMVLDEPLEFYHDWFLSKFMVKSVMYRSLINMYRLEQNFHYLFWLKHSTIIYMQSALL